MRVNEILNEGYYDHLEPSQQTQHITNPRVLNLKMSPYDLTKLMREFRSGTNSYGKINDSAMVSFYSPEEQKEFEAYLRRKGVSYSRVDDQSPGD